MVTGYTGGGEESSPRKSKPVDNINFTGDVSAMPDLCCGIYDLSKTNANPDFNWKSTLHETKRVFKIPVGSIPDDEIENYIRKVAERFKKTPSINYELFDCDYKLPDCDIFIPPYSAATSTYSTNFYQVIPGSHFFSDLNQVLTYIDSIRSSGNQWYENAFKAELDYMKIGLKNTIDEGYKIRIIEDSKLDFSQRPYHVFMSVESILSMINGVNLSGDYKGNEFLNDLTIAIENTIQCGYNLTNGLKMERKEVYKRIDGERDYQDQTWVARRTANGTPDEDKPVAEWINYLEFHLAKAKNEVYYLKTEAALAELRKVAALAVRAMEIHGCPERIIAPEKSCCSDGCSCKKDK